MRSILRLLALLCAVALPLGCVMTDEPLDEPSPGGLSDEPATHTGSLELDLLTRVNRERALHGLAPVAHSPALDEVARQHVADLEANYPYEPCNLHSWSQDGPWTACCYSDLAPVPECMWNKPAELTGYEAPGFEIAASVFGKEPITVRRAVDLWLDSPSHRELLLNQGTWADDTWRAAGAAISEHYAVVWFGKEPDPSAL